MDQSRYYNSHSPPKTYNPTDNSKMAKSLHYSNSDYWTMDRVIHWLEANDFNRNVIEVFKARNICGKTFLDVDMSYLMAFQNELMLSYSDKRKLAHAIKALKAPEDSHANPSQPRSNYNSSRHNLSTTTLSNNGQRYTAPTENIAPLIPERKSSNNEHVLDWMKSFSIPKRPYITTANVANNTIGATAVSGTRNHQQHLPTMNHAFYNHTIANGHSGAYQHHNPHHNFPVSPNSPRIAHLNQLPVPSAGLSSTSAQSPAASDGSWKLARRRPMPSSSTTTNPLSNVSMNMSYGDQTIRVTPPPPPPQQPQQFIHVTRDSDTFHSLQVTGMHDPRLIKNSIIRKLGLEGKCENYRFFHENGKQADVPLTDSELSHICQTSDHSATNRILVRPISVVSNDDNHHYYAMKQQQQQQYSSINNSNTARCYSNYSPDSQYPSNNTTHDIQTVKSNAKSHVAIVDPLKRSKGFGHNSYSDKTANTEHVYKASGDTSVITEAISSSPKSAEALSSNRSSTSSSDNPAFYQQASELKPKDNTHSLWPVHNSPQSYQQQPVQNEKATSSHTLWAVPPRKSPLESKPSPAVSLWAVPPASTNAKASENVANSATVKTGAEKVASVSLWAVPPSKQTPSPISSPKPSLWAVAPKSQHQKAEFSNTEATQPAMNTQTVSLWATPPSTQQNTIGSTSPAPPIGNGIALDPQRDNQTNTTEDKDCVKKGEAAVSLWAVHPSSTASKQNVSSFTPQPSLWAVPPQPQGQRNTSDNADKKAPTVSLWAVPPIKEQRQQEAAKSKSSASAQDATQQSHSPSTDENDKFTHDGTVTDVAENLPDTLMSNSKDLHFLHESSTNASKNCGTADGNTKHGNDATAYRTRTVQFTSDMRSDNEYDEHDTVSSASSVVSAPELKGDIEELSISLSDEEDKNKRGHTTNLSHHHHAAHSRNNSATNLHVDTSSARHTHLTDETNANDKVESPSLSSPSHSGRNTDPLTDEENWAERPSVDRLYKDIDKYLPGHDLDKEIIVNEPVTMPATCIESGKNRISNSGNIEPGETPTMVSSLPPNRRLVGHRKSIRNVAREAHRNWRNAVNVIRANNNLIRRRSTKMWHRNVEQVKPGDKIEPITPDVPADAAMSTVTDAQEQGSQQQQQQKSNGGLLPPKSRKLQWIRGELIGKGSFGRVYHALNVEAGEWIAVKQVDLPTTKSDYGGTQSSDMKDALFREISLLEDLDNEYVVQYLGYDVDQAEGYINIFLEYVPGGSIASCLAKTGEFEVPLVRFFTRQILMGVAYLHSRNVLHRDIKAGNILLDQNGVCKITDFGLSKLSGQDKAYDPHSNNSVMRGTVFWMAPEVVKGTKYNAKVDIWSLGCTVIEMLTGKHPWLDLNMLAALYSLGKYQAPPIPDDIPDDVHDFLEKCFIINPEDRPTAEQLLSHPFVQPDPAFDFKKYMRKVELERRQSRKFQKQQHQQHTQQPQQFQTDPQTHTIPVKN